MHGVESIRRRRLAPPLLAALEALPVVVLTGARQTEQVTPSDADGIAAFRRSLGQGRRCRCGAVLHAGAPRTLGEDLFALPWGWLLPQVAP